MAQTRYLLVREMNLNKTGSEAFDTLLYARLLFMQLPTDTVEEGRFIQDTTKTLFCYGTRTVIKIIPGQ